MPSVAKPRLAGMLALALSACATHEPSPVVDAATAPLNDLNLVYAEIPAALLKARTQPYALPAEPGCAELAAEIRDLDEVLGPDLDVPAPAKPGLIERGADTAGNAAVGALRRTTEGILPFRSWVRMLSGAEKHSKQVAAAIAAGVVRRAFLKGLRVSRQCGGAI